ncbi:MAG: zinc-binding dehydrogenase [Anaerolineales bacterium]|jgi:L-iditol 2-dehydrogenase
MTAEMMRAQRFYEPGKLVLEEIPRPEPGPGELLVKVRAATTCGTDVKTYKRGHPKIIPPILFGHEFAGDVVAIGEGVENFKVGMRVVPHNTAPCNTCFYCKHGQENLCDQLVYNFGAYSEYALIPAPIVTINTFELPEHMTYAQASILEPLVSVAHGQRVLQIQPGEHVAIIGAGGPIGLMHLQMARHAGAAQVIAVDLSEPRLEVARQLGATATINPGEEDPVEAIHNLTEGRGADVTIESAGALAAWETAFKAVRKGGRVNWFGGLKGGTDIQLDTGWIHYGELTLYGTYHGTPLDVYRSFELLRSGVIDTQSLISAEMPLSQVEDALELMYAGEVIKVVINPELN